MGGDIAITIPEEEMQGLHWASRQHFGVAFSEELASRSARELLAAWVEERPPQTTYSNDTVLATSAQDSVETVQQIGSARAAEIRHSTGELTVRVRGVPRWWDAFLGRDRGGIVTTLHWS